MINWIDNLPPKQRGIVWAVICILVVHFFFPQLRVLLATALYIWAIPDFYAILEHRNGLTPMLFAKLIIGTLILCFK